MNEPVYLDHNGTTPVDAEVLEAMLPFFRRHFGNPSSATPLGRCARDAIENARGQVAALIGADPREIIFTGGGTEASNHAIFGFVARAPAHRRRIVTSSVEHPATDVPCQRLVEHGFQVRRLAVDRTGVVRLDQALAAIDADTALVTIIHAQNEVGTIQPVAELVDAARRHGVPIHVDAAQSVGKLPIDVKALGVDALTLAGHKLYAPKGVGALYLRREHDLPSLLGGAGQEAGRRPGTENVPYIVGLGQACTIAQRWLAAEPERLAVLREHLWERLAAGVGGLIRVGAGAPCLPNTLNVLFPRIDGGRLLAATPEVAASTGSACHAGQARPSSVLLALGYAPDLAMGAVRLSLGRATTEADVDRAAAALVSSWKALSSA